MTPRDQVLDVFFSNFLSENQRYSTAELEVGHPQIRWPNSIESIHTLVQIFNSDNLINIAYKSMARRDQVLDAGFSSFLSDIQFS